MSNDLRLLCVVAHPGDETLAFGGTLARYAAEGVATAVVVATRGEQGWAGNGSGRPAPEAVASARESELRAAALRLGVADVTHLGFRDGAVDGAVDAAGAVVAEQIRRFQPQVVATFGPDGGDGHPDHAAVSRIATAACVLAAAGGGQRPHRPAKLYYRVWTENEHEALVEAFGPSALELGGVVRRGMSWPEWAVTSKIDAADRWRAVRSALACHRSQFADPALLGRIPDDLHRRLWGGAGYVRAYDLVGAGCGQEQDLFAGLREPVPARAEAQLFEVAVA